MAKVYSEELVITVSTIIKDKDPDVAQLINEKLVENVEAIVQELVGEAAIVEVQKIEK